MKHLSILDNNAPLNFSFTCIHKGTVQRGDLYLDIRDRKTPLKPIDERHIGAPITNLMPQIVRFIEPPPSTII